MTRVSLIILKLFMSIC